MFSAFNNAVPTPMYNYQPIIPKPEIIPGFDEDIQRDLLTMIFLSKIPPYIDDDDILELLASCGSVRSWKRVVNADNSPTDYGFCTFEKEIGVIKALRSIPPKNAAKDKNSKIATHYEDLNTLKVSIDVATRNHIRKDPEYGVEKDDYEVEERKKYMFEPFVGVDLDRLMKEINNQQVVLRENLFEEESEEEDEEIIQRREEKRLREKEIAFNEVRTFVSAKPAQHVLIL
jgi:RNA recognition motif-containing protein